jgi:PPK2 family polyphosphate:nucleotide phosphotransferase
MFTEKFIVKPSMLIQLTEVSTADTGKYKSKKEAKSDLKNNIKKMIKLQDKLYAHNRYSMLLIFQAMDAAGKDGTIKHVMSGLNPQGTQVVSFKQPSAEELDHGYLWRIFKALPERGRIGIFNRSHYEDVLVVRVHDLHSKQQLPEKFLTENIWENRYRQINDFERYLHENGTIILKFFLHVSKEEQKNRFLKRINKQSKNWKFSEADIDERKNWDKYQEFYSETLSATSKEYAPWFVIPADKKWFMRLAVSEIIIEAMEQLDISYPQLSDDEIKNLERYKEKLISEK